MSTNSGVDTATEILAKDVFATRCLGLPVFRLLAPGQLREAAAALPSSINGPIMIEAKVPVSEVQLLGRLTASGFAVVDVGVQLDAPASMLRARPEPPSRSWVVRDAAEPDCEPVARVAGQALTTSRFHLDPRIEPGRASELKREWVRNFFRGLRGQRLLVADVDGEVAGFLQVLERAGQGTIDLIALLPVIRGAGAAGDLIRHWLIGSAAITDVRVGTQVSNVRSLRAYERLGFRIRESAYVLHFHGDAAAFRGASA